MKLWLLGAIAGLTMHPAVANKELDATFEKDTLIVEASKFACHRFDVYIAANNSQRARGLMHVRDLPPMTGMLFVYGDARFISMWMKNTYIPLDMVFARADGSVATVVHDTEPLSLRTLASSEPVSFVLELNAGTAARLWIDEDSRLFWEQSRDPY